MPEESSGLSLSAFSEVLGIRNPNGRPYVLIGGQAVNFWAERYLGIEPALGKFSPFTSRDIDYLGSKADVEHMAGQLKRKPSYPYWRAMTALAGTIPLQLAATDSVIEVVRLIPGIPSQKVEASALPANFLGHELRVMFPIHLLICKAHLVRTIDQKGRQDVFHLKIMVLCVRAFLAESLTQVEADVITTRDWLNIVKDLLAFTESDLGMKVSRQHGLDWSVILPELKTASVFSASIRTFYEKRVPAWQARVRKAQAPGAA
jgi:hypothetical protein